MLCGILNCFDKGEDPFKTTTDSSADKLSYVGSAAYNALRFKHAWHHKEQWNVTTGKPIGSLHQTPKGEVFDVSTDPTDRHDDWFPEALKQIMIRTTTWCDLMSLGPPDGLFLTKIQEALLQICKTASSNPAEKPIIIRMMFGNIVGMPVNCDKIIKKLTEKLPEDANIQLWVGAWRKGASWNHAKLIAVDGRCLHTGGHNLWHPHYLENNPVHDLSIEMEGRVAHDGHLVRFPYYLFKWAFYLYVHAVCTIPMSYSSLIFDSNNRTNMYSLQMVNGALFRENSLVVLGSALKRFLTACPLSGKIALSSVNGLPIRHRNSLLNTILLQFLVTKIQKEPFLSFHWAVMELSP